MSCVKTAISIEQGLFEQADHLAGKLHISRSRLFAEAMKALIRKYEGQEITRRLNEVYKENPLDAEEQRFLKAAEIDLIERGHWEW